MDTLYTPLEANALYNKCKIAWNPKSYTLKDDLKLVEGTDVTYACHIFSYNFDAEDMLVKAISEGEKIDIHSNLLPKASYGIGPLSNVPEIAFAIVKHNDLLVSMSALLTHVGKMFLKNGAMEAIVQTCVALSSPESCCKALIHGLYDTPTTYKYSELLTLQWLRDCLESKSDGIPVMRPVDMDSYLPSTDTTASVEKLKYGVIRTLLYGIEVFWALENLTFPEKKTDLYEYFGRNDDGVDGLLYTPAGKYPVFNPDVINILSEDDVEARYKLILQYVTNHTSEIEAVVKKYAAGSATGIPALLGILISYAIGTAFTYYRVNSTRILYNYAVANKFYDPKKSRSASDFTALESMFDLTSDEDLTSSYATPKKETKERSLIDPVEDSMKGPGVSMTPDTKTIRSPTYDALDEIESEYNEGGYSFETKDLFSDSTSAKASYQAVAKKVGLVNKNLIRQLNDIKVYNTGGKQPGELSGRLDRKALYRHSYDPGIFYQNTYKQLESDLAFGIVLDMSGSMRGPGIENGRTVMIVLHETLKAIGVNHCIIGHTSEGHHQCTIYRFQSFREDKTYRAVKNYALADVRALDGNCDSASLFYIEKAFERVRNRDKVCMIFSDGQPTECSDKELKDQVKHMEAKGIKVIGIGINFEEIAEYYTDYANGRNLSEMLNIVIKILKEYVLKKKDR